MNGAHSLRNVLCLRHPISAIPTALLKIYVIFPWNEFRGFNMNGAPGTRYGPCLRHSAFIKKFAFGIPGSRPIRFINALGMVDVLASEFIPWMERRKISKNAVGMAHLLIRS